MFCLVSGQKVPVISTAFGMLDYMMKMPIPKNIRISLTPNPAGKNSKNRKVFMRFIKLVSFVIYVYIFRRNPIMIYLGDWSAEFANITNL
jgi:hypothetical protein